MALGAQRGDVQWLVFRETVYMVVAGMGAGLIAAFASTRLVATMLYGVKPVDATVFAGAGRVAGGS